MDDILLEYPSVTSSFTLGQSYESRTIRGIKISYKTGNAGVFIESNIHAREWITSATATWFINELLTSTDEDVRNLAENYDWYIVPVLNVDGFTYTHNKVSQKAYFISQNSISHFEKTPFFSRIVCGEKLVSQSHIPRVSALMVIVILILSGW